MDRPGKYGPALTLPHRIRSLAFPSPNRSSNEATAKHQLHETHVVAVDWKRAAKKFSQPYYCNVGKSARIQIITRNFIPLFSIGSRVHLPKTFGNFHGKVHRVKNLFHSIQVPFAYALAL